MPLLASVPLLILFSFCEHSSYPLPTQEILTHSLVLSSIVIFSSKTPYPLPCLQIGLNTWPSVHHGTGSYLECTNMRSYKYLYINIVSAWRIGAHIGTEQTLYIYIYFELINGWQTYFSIFKYLAFVKPNLSPFCLPEVSFHQKHPA